MSRSLKKGPFVDAKLMKRITAMNTGGRKEVLRTWSRDSTLHGPAAITSSLPPKVSPSPRRRRRCAPTTPPWSPGPASSGCSSVSPTPSTSPPAPAGLSTRTPGQHSPLPLCKRARCHRRHQTDNSLDSRYSRLGFVKRDDLVGRARLVLLSHSPRRIFSSHD